MKRLLAYLFLVLGLGLVVSVKAEANKYELQYCLYEGNSWSEVKKWKSTFRVGHDKCKIIDKRKNRGLFLGIVKHMRPSLNKSPTEYTIDTYKLKRLIAENKKEPSQTQEVAKSVLSECKGNDKTQWTNCRGTYISSWGDKYIGEWKDGVLHGQGTYTFPNFTNYIGEFKDGKRHGQGTEIWPGGNKYAGEYKDGKRGTDKELRYGQVEINMLENIKMVNGTDKEPTLGLMDGNTLENWKDGKRHGQGTYTWPDGRIVKGIWKKNQLVESNTTQTQIAKAEPSQTQQAA